MPCPELEKKKKKNNPKKYKIHTPIVSEAQRRAMAVAEFAPETAYGAALEMAKSMSKAELKRHRKEAEGKKLVLYKKRKKR